MKKFLLTLATMVACIFAADAQIYLRGDMNDWTAPSEWKFSTADGVNYELKNVVIPAGARFKIASEDWATVDYGSYSNAEIGEWEFLVYGGPDIKLNYGDASAAPVDVYFNLKLAALAIVWAGEEAGPIPSENKPEIYDIYLRGSMNDWAANDEWKFKYNGDNQYVMENVRIYADQEFKLADENWGEINYGLSYPLTVGSSAILEHGGPNITLEFPDAVSPVNLYFDLNTNELTVTPVALPLYGIFLRGDMNGWGVSEEYRFTTEDHVLFILEHAYIPLNSQFKIADENWSVVNYGCENPLEIDYTNYLSHSGSNMWINQGNVATEYFNFYFDLMYATLLITTEPLHIDSAITDETTPIYYNLQGIRINHPEPGNFYIVKTGTKVQKTVIR